MAEFFLPSTPTDGNMLVKLLSSVEDLHAITIDEANAESSLDISCYLAGGGYTPSLDEQVIADERLCDKQTREAPGRHSRGLELTYIDNTNAPDSTDINKAVETLVPGSRHVVLVRRGLPYETPLAAGQTYTAYRIVAGQYNELPPESNSVFKVTQKEFVGGSAIREKLVA